MTSGKDSFTCASSMHFPMTDLSYECHIKNHGTHCWLSGLYVMSWIESSLMLCNHCFLISSAISHNWGCDKGWPEAMKWVIRLTKTFSSAGDKSWSSSRHSAWVLPPSTQCHRVLKGISKCWEAAWILGNWSFVKMIMARWHFLLVFLICSLCGLPMAIQGGHVTQFRGLADSFGHLTHLATVDPIYINYLKYYIFFILILFKE